MVGCLGGGSLACSPNLTGGPKTAVEFEYGPPELSGLKREDTILFGLLGDRVEAWRSVEDGSVTVWGCEGSEGWSVEGGEAEGGTAKRTVESYRGVKPAELDGTL